MSEAMTFCVLPLVDETDTGLAGSPRVVQDALGVGRYLTRCEMWFTRISPTRRYFAARFPGYVGIYSCGERLLERLTPAKRTRGSRIMVVWTGQGLTLRCETLWYVVTTGVNSCSQAEFLFWLNEGKLAWIR